METRFECRLGEARKRARWAEDPTEHSYHRLEFRSCFSRMELEDFAGENLEVLYRDALIERMHGAFVELLDVAPKPPRLMWRFPHKIIFECRAEHGFDLFYLTLASRIAVVDLEWIPLSMHLPESMVAPRVTLPETAKANG